MLKRQKMNMCIIKKKNNTLEQNNNCSQNEEAEHKSRL